jgi:hypothetical protein
VALLVVLVLVQRYLAVRFRRRFNGPLLVASVLLAALAGTAVVVLVTDHQLAVAGVDVERVLGEQPSQVPSQLGANLAGYCRRAAPPDCDVTPATFQEELDASPGVTPVSAAVETALRDLTATATADANRAALSDGVEIAIPAVAVLVAGLIVLGLRPRIDEYRYRT